jgi:hypothetical protein
MRKHLQFLAVVALLAASGSAALAQTSVTQDAYRAGFDAGFREGYDRALADVRARQAQEAQTTRQITPGTVHHGTTHHGSQGVVQGAAPVRPAVRNRGIVVVHAAYGANEGRDRRSCDLTRDIYNQSVGKVQHDINVSNQLCGDPAPSVRKSLRVTYLCGGEEKVAEANEHRSLRLDCSQ